MTKVNRGKDFEGQIHDAFLKSEYEVERIPDQMSGFAGSSNICDFIVYKYPYIGYIECKSCYGNTLSISSNGEKRHYGDISDTQWNALLKRYGKKGIVSGYIVWFIDYDLTVFISAATMKALRDSGAKSFNIRNIDMRYPDAIPHYVIKGKKRRVLFDYDMTNFMENTVDL